MSEELYLIIILKLFNVLKNTKIKVSCVTFFIFQGHLKFINAQNRILDFFLNIMKNLRVALINTIHNFGKYPKCTFCRNGELS